MTVVVSGLMSGMMDLGRSGVEGVAYGASGTRPRKTSASGWMPSGSGMPAIANAVG